MTRRIVQHRSPIHGNGVFAATDIPKGTRLIRYRGKILTHEQANRRYGNDVDSGHTFLFTLNEKYLIDANEGGNIARWINHSCSPNCQAWVIEHDSKDPKRDQVVIESKRAIHKGRGTHLRLRHRARRGAHRAHQENLAMPVRIAALHRHDPEAQAQTESEGQGQAKAKAAKKKKAA